MDDEKQVSEWKESYEKWCEENKHLPNLSKSEVILERLKQQMEAKKNQSQTLDARVTSIEQKIDKLMVHLGVK